MSGKIIFYGAYLEQNILYFYKEISSRKIDPEVESKVEELWQEKLDKAKAEGRQIWDQPIFRLEEYYTNKHTCKLTFSTISYKTQSIIAQFSSILQSKGEEYMPMGTYTSFFIETMDGKFVFGEKSSKFVTNRSYSYIGGVFNQDTLDVHSINLFNSAKKELEEELGINIQNHVKNLVLIGASQNNQGIAGFIFYCKLSLLAEEVQKIFEQNNDLELKALHYITRSEIREFCVEKIKKESTIVDLFEKYELDQKNKTL